MPTPSWCAKPKPCDYDERSAYCPHRECRRKLIDEHDLVYGRIAELRERMEAIGARAEEFF